MNFDAYMNPTDFDHLPCCLSTDDLLALAQSEKYGTLLSLALADRLETVLEEMDRLARQIGQVRDVMARQGEAVAPC